MSYGYLTGKTAVDVSTLNSTNTLTVSGAASGDKTGYSVADAGNVNAASGSVDDLLIGSPGAASTAGAAYLIYGGSGLAGLQTTNNGQTYLNVGNIAGTGSGNIPGATIQGNPGAVPGSMTGFSVSAGGDFNGDGFGDILIGAPNFSTTANTNVGQVFMLYGASSSTSAYLTGVIPLASLPTAIQGVEFDGASAGNLAGYSESQVGFINTGQPTSILIGAPGYSSSSGTAYLIPGRSGLTGVYSLATAESTPLSGNQFFDTTPSDTASSPPFFGASVSSRIQGTQANTADLDNRADFIVGAPGYDVTQAGGLALAGGAQIVQTGYITVNVPVSNSVTVQIGVDKPFGPFTINATTPTNLSIYVFGSTATTPAFMPVTDIDPTTVVINGVAYPNATIVEDPNTADWLNGIPDAIITVTPRSALNLPNGVTTITAMGKTLASSPLPNYTWTGTATVTVTGGSITPVPSAVRRPAQGPVVETTFISPYGANQYSPSISQFSQLNYQPIPLSVAIAEYLPAPGFRARLYSFNHPNKKIRANNGQNTGRASGINTLGSHVFSRGRFHASQAYTWTHHTAKVGTVTGVVPIQLKKQRFNDNLIH